MTYDDWKTTDDTPLPEPSPCEECKHEEGDCDCPCCNEPEVFRCEACGQEFEEWHLGHSRARHASDCDGSCSGCPVEEQCGPISRVGA